MCFRRDEINTSIFSKLEFSVYKIFYHISNLLVVRTLETHPGISKRQKGKKLVMKQEKKEKERILKVFSVCSERMKLPFHVYYPSLMYNNNL